MGLELNRIYIPYLLRTQPHGLKANQRQPQRFTLYCSRKYMQIRTSIVQIGNSPPPSQQKSQDIRNERLLLYGL